IGIDQDTAPGFSKNQIPFIIQPQLRLPHVSGIKVPKGFSSAPTILNPSIHALNSTIDNNRQGLQP
ncbi:MAG: hypothetical protein ACLFQ9_05160, partial [Desulfobacterales bacterium]